MDVDLARQQWQDGYRRLEESRSDRGRYVVLQARVDTLLAGLRGRVGQSFTLDDLASAYDGADEWAQNVLSDADPEQAPPLEVGTVADAAFHLYARGAADYRP